MVGTLPTSGPGRRRSGHPTAGGVSREGRCNEGRGHGHVRGAARPRFRGRRAGWGLGRGRGAPGGGEGRAEGGPMPPLVLPGRGLYSEERGSRSEAARSAPTCKWCFAAQPGARVTAAGSAGQGDPRSRGQLQAVGQRSPARSESPVLALLLPRTPLSHLLATWVKLTTPAAARPSPGVRGSHRAGSRDARAAAAWP